MFVNFSDFLMPLTSNFCSGMRIYFAFQLLSLLGFILWPSIRPVMGKIPFSLENVYSAVRGFVSLSSHWLTVFGCSGLQYPCWLSEWFYPRLRVRCWKFSIIVTEFFTFPFSFASCILGALFRTVITSWWIYFFIL